jgi:hypothetical protein
MDESPKGTMLQRPSSKMQTAGFVVIGVFSTVAYMALFLVLHKPLGAQFANVAALCIYSVANARYHAFGLHALRHPFRTHSEDIIVFFIGLGLTSAMLTLIETARPNSGVHAQLAAVTIANLLAAASKAVLFRPTNAEQ